MKRRFIRCQSGFRHGCQARRNSPTFKKKFPESLGTPPLFGLLMVTALSSFQGHDWEPDYMVSFSPGSNIASPTGWNIVAITCSISAWAQNANFHEKVEVRKHSRCACSRFFWDEKNASDYMKFSAPLAGLKILARFEDTGLGFLARAELRPGLNPSPCINTLILRGFVSKAGLKFQL